MDFGKFKYRLEKEERKAKQKRQQLKEIRLRMTIEPHDFQVKKNKIEDFLKKGHKIKVTLMLRGREMMFTERAFEFLAQLEKELGEKAKREKGPERLGNRISVIFSKR